MNINLWRDLYERLSGSVPPSEDFKIHLSEISSDRDRAYKDGDTIRNLYIDALKYYNNELGKTIKKSGSQLDKKVDKVGEDEKLPEHLIMLKSGETNIVMKKTEANINILISTLNELKKEIYK